MTDVCLICLDGPQKNSPLNLMFCGCNSSWFHEQCEKTFIDNTTVPLQCPVCRRNFSMKTNYSFSPFAGDEQKNLYITLCLFSFEIFYSSYYSFILLPVETFVVLCIPFMIRSGKSLDYFCGQIKAKYILQYILMLYKMYSEGYSFLVNPIDLYHSFFLLGIVQITVLLPCQLIHASLIQTDPLLPYAISREIIHKETVQLD